MAITYPTSLDNFTNPTTASNMSDVAVLHSDQHANANDAIEALQVVVGVTGSTVPTSHTKKIADLEASVAGKQSTLVAGTNITIVGSTISASGGGGSSVAVLDEGVSLTSGVTSINFMGAVVTASATGNAVTVDVSGSTGSGATNLTTTVSPSSVTISSDTGTDATIPVATTTNAGVFSATDKTKLTGIATGATANSTDAVLLDRVNHTGTQGVSTITGLQTALDTKASLSVATTSVDGLMSSSDKTKLNGIATGATVNSTDTYLKDRTNHTGVQDIGTVSGLQLALDTKADTASVLAAVSGVVGAAPTNLNTLVELASAINNDPFFSTTTATSLAGKASTVHNHAIADVVGLQTALNAKATPADVSTAIAALVGAAPTALDTLVELSTALGNDANFAGTITTSLAGKAPTVHTHVIADVTNLQTTLDAKAGTAIATTSVSGLMSSGDKTKLNGIATGATANSTDAVLLDRVNHTGVQSIGTVTGLQTALDDKAALTHTHTIAGVTGLQTALDAKAGTAIATVSTAGLMSAADKYQVNNMPSPQFLWDAVHARTPIIAHAGDSISYMTGQGSGNNFLMQCLSREYPARIEYGEHVVQCYTGNLSATVNGDGTATLFYDGGDDEATIFESHLLVNKWLFFPTSGVGNGWDGQEMQILSFDTVTNTITVNSAIQYMAVTGPLMTFGTIANVALKISETANRYVLAKGGHTSTQIKNGQITAIQAWTVPPDIMILNGGTNDGTYLTSHTNVIEVAEAALAAGVKIVALMPMSPKDGMSSNPNAMRQFISSKNIVATYARNRDGCYLVDPSGEFLDPASAYYQPIGASSGSINAVMADGLHPSVRGAELSAKYITPLIQKIAARRYPKALSIADVWDDTNNKAGNILGSSGTMLAGAGGTLNGVANTPGLAEGWTVLTNTVSTVQGAQVAPVVSIVDCNYVAAGYKAQRFDFTGLYAGQWGGVLSMNFSRWQPAIFAANPRFDAEMVIRINCPNIYSARLSVGITGGTSQGDSIDIGSTGVNAAGTVKVSGDYIFLTLKRPFFTYSFNQQLDFSIVINALYDAPLSGYIDIAHCGAFALHTS